MPRAGNVVITVPEELRDYVKEFFEKYKPELRKMRITSVSAVFQHATLDWVEKMKKKFEEEASYEVEEQATSKEKRGRKRRA